MAVMNNLAENYINRLEAEVVRLRGIIDIITGPPLTQEEAEAALADVTDNEAAEAAQSIDIEKIIAYAMDPANMSPEWAVRRMIEAAKRVHGFDESVLRQAEDWLERRFP